MSFIGDKNHFESFISSCSDDTLSPLRREAFERVSQISIPSTKEESWKYTSLKKWSDLQYLNFQEEIKLTEEQYGQIQELKDEKFYNIIFVNGKINSTFSDTIENYGKIHVSSISQKIKENPQFIKNLINKKIDQKTPEEYFTNLNTSFLQDGLVFHFEREQTLDRPLQVLHISIGNNQGPVMSSHLRILGVLEENAEATILERFISLGKETAFTNPIWDIHVKEGAQLKHSQVQSQNLNSLYVGRLNITQERNSKVESFACHLGTQLSRNDLKVIQRGEGAEVFLYGFYATRDKQHVDFHTEVSHRASHGGSQQFYKGILADQSRGVFNGKINIQPNAQKIDSLQLNKNILLSSQAEIDTKPELNIDADDVKANHGATIGKLNEEEIFYLMSRGISRKESIQLLAHGFAGEVVGQISNQMIQDKVGSIVSKALINFNFLQTDEARTLS